MEKELYLTDLVDARVLQRIQDAFSNLTGMAALTTDADGTPVTEGSNFTEFCIKYARSTPVGRGRCEQCDKFGAHATWKNGKSTTYYCHAGLIDYAAPIIADGHLVGCFIGGQVLDKEPDLEQIERVAEEIEVEPGGLVAAVKKVHILGKENIDHAAEFLCTIANVLSDIAYGKYLALQANREIEKAANMKSDFLANMSHEIRTPMNAVIGMAEMALREDLSPAAREYIHQIKSSGKTLLTIINDILDFSKIESGKMDIVPVEYEPMSIVCDITNILVTRLKDKDVELVLDISPDIPNKLLGDSIRIKQILLNIANNAVKFTAQGQVVIHMSHTVLADDRINLCVSVEDTGIGIRQENLGKLFQSFQQLDSKRNRNIEGTGLGLAISRRLVMLMDGEMQVESEYEKGSTFSFSVPQKVVDPTGCIHVADASSVLAMGLLDSPYIKRQLAIDCTYLEVEYRELASIGELYTLSTEKSVFLFMEQKSFNTELENFIKNNPAITVVLLMEANTVTEDKAPDLRFVRKPLFTLSEAMIFNREKPYYYYGDADAVDIDFIAPAAEILIVDDNAINLTVTEGLLEPLKMKIDTALSGKEAIDKISTHHYDIVFMDHMMPELDGVETTHIIRRFRTDYQDVPIIALTANAVGGVEEMFLREGMNDFVAKPIEFRTLLSKVKKWLPAEKIRKGKENQHTVQAQSSMKESTVGDLDVKSAIRLLGNEKLFWAVLKDYYKLIDSKSNHIKELMEKEDWTGYTIEVHALKSASRQIGAVSLAEKAAAMEKAGNAGDVARIQQCTDEMLQQYRAYLPVLEPFFSEETHGDAEKKEISTALLQELFAEMREASDNLDSDGMAAVIGKMDQYRYEGWQENLFRRLKDAVDQINVDICEEILAQWESSLYRVTQQSNAICSNPLRTDNLRRRMIRVTVWNEYVHEQKYENIRAVYPEGIHGCIASFLEKDPKLQVRTATFQEPEHGLTEEVLEQTDVLIFWSHARQEEFADQVAERIQRHVLQGMGLIALHSAHYSKVMKRLLGTSMTLRWRHEDRERLFVTAPGHPIAAGLPAYIEIPKEEMYGEYFDIPKPDDVVFTGWFAGGEVFRSGCTFTRGLGRIFYFQPGHEEYPIYFMEPVRQIIRNAVKWCAPTLRRSGSPDCTQVTEPLEGCGEHS